MARFKKLEELEPWTGDLDAPLPLPSDLIHGVLPNGLSYFIRPSKKPGSRASMALAVKTGSVLEEDREHGVSHILEHLAFSATESFERHDVVKYLESIGASFGACTNAYTSFDETVYEFFLPTDKPGLLEKGLEIFAEFACKIRCSQSDLDLERGAVLDEYRLRMKSASGRIEIAYWKLATAGSPYGDRTVIGTEESIRGANAELVRKYYEKWYHPGLMALCISGDFKDGGKAVEKLVKKILGKVTTPALAGQPGAPLPPPPVIPKHPLPLHTEPRVAVYVDKEASTTSLSVTWKRAKLPENTGRDYERQVQEQLFLEAFNTRLYKMSRGKNPPFFTVGCDGGDLGNCETLSIGCTVEGGVGRASRALEVILTEIARVRLHGLSEPEVRRAKAASLSETEAYLMEGGHKYAGDIRAELVRHFLTGEVVLDPVLEARCAKTFIDRASPQAIVALAHQLHPENSLVIKVTEHKSATTTQELQAVIQRCVLAEKEGRVGPWTLDQDTPECIVSPSDLPPPGSIVTSSVHHWPGFDCKAVTLSNGMKVVLKRTDFMEEEISLRAFAPGGISQLPQDIFHESMLAKLLAEELGIFGVKPEVQDDLLAGQRCELGVNIGSFWRTFEGEQCLKDLETTFQLIFKLFTVTVRPSSPSDLDACAMFIKESLQARDRDPFTKFSRRCRELNFGDNIYFRSLSSKDVDNADRNLALEIFNRAFSDPSEWTLVIVGSLPEEKALEVLLNTYLSCIPTPGVNKRKAAEGKSKTSKKTRVEASKREDDGGAGPSTLPQSPVKQHHTSLTGHIPSQDVLIPLTGSGSREHDDGEVAGTAPSSANRGFTGRLASSLAKSLGLTSAADKAGAVLSAKRALNWGFKVSDLFQIKPIPWEFPAMAVRELVHVKMVDTGHSQTLVTLPVTLYIPEGQSLATGDYYSLILVERVLETRLVDLLRFKFGETYSVSASLYFGATCPSECRTIRGDLQFTFSCTPDLSEVMTTMCLDAMDRFQRDGPTVDELKTVIEILERTREVELGENAYWLQYICDGLRSRKYARDADLDGYFQRTEEGRAKAFAAALADPKLLVDISQRLIPYPCRSRYTAISSVPEDSVIKRILTLRPLRRLEWVGAGVGYGLLGAGLSTVIRSYLLGV